MFRCFLMNTRTYFLLPAEHVFLFCYLLLNMLLCFIDLYWTCVRVLLLPVQSVPLFCCFMMNTLPYFISCCNKSCLKRLCGKPRYKSHLTSEKSVCVLFVFKHKTKQQDPRHECFWTDMFLFRRCPEAMSLGIQTSNRPPLSIPKMIYEWIWKSGGRIIVRGRPKYADNKCHVPALLYPPQLPFALPWQWTLGSAVNRVTNRLSCVTAMLSLVRKLRTDSARDLSSSFLLSSSPFIPSSCLLFVYKWVICCVLLLIFNWTLR